MELTVSSLFLGDGRELLFLFWLVAAALPLAGGVILLKKNPSLGRTRKLLKLSGRINSIIFRSAAPDPDDDRQNRRSKKIYRRFVVKAIVYQNPWLCPEMPLPTFFEEGVKGVSLVLQLFVHHMPVAWASLEFFRWWWGAPPVALSEVFWTTGFFWCALTVLDYLLGNKGDSGDEE